jgi:hypothetical protein
LPLAVDLDGGYVHSSQQCDGSAKPKRRLFEVLKSQGMAMANL